jgi:hypothetical protein
MHSGMNSAMMSCCKAAFGSDNALTRSGASLCCAINCPEPASPGGHASFGVSRLPVSPLHPVVAGLLAAESCRLPPFENILSLNLSRPTYIRNLALLI